MGNYKLANRQIGLDETQTRLVLKKIAKFHAASMVLAKKVVKYIIEMAEQRNRSK